MIGLFGLYWGDHKGSPVLVIDLFYGLFFVQCRVYPHRKKCFVWQAAFGK
jgi:hypothetical protein